MKKLKFIGIILTAALLFCACEKENTDLLLEENPQSQLDETALKGAAAEGMTKVHITTMPMWARIGAGSPNVIPTTDEYGIVIFYVTDPALIGDWDFIEDGWFAPGAAAVPAENYALETDAWFLPDYPMAPHHYDARGKGDVLFWIITFDQVMLAIGDGHLTIPEIASYDPLVGHASVYHEHLKPYGGGAKVNSGEFNAHGTLEDGRHFVFHMMNIVKPGAPMKANVKFEIVGD